MKKIYIYTLAGLMLWGASSCKKPNDFGTTNLDPSATTKPIVSALLASVMSGVGGYASTNAYAIGPGAYAQYFSETQYPGTSLYTLPNTDFTGSYNGSLYDLQNVINLNQDKNSVAVAKILQSYIFWVLTDSYGDIPYSQALQGIKVITPAYDKQEDIYKGLLTTLSSAVASMDGGTVQGDLIYGGDAASWKRAANSLSMLIAIQASKASDNAFAKAAFTAAMNAGPITTNAQNFAVVYPGSTYSSPWYNLYNGRTDWAESKTVTDTTSAYNDPRTNPFGGSFSDPAQTTGGTVTSNVGVPYGLGRTAVTAFTAANPTWALVLRADLRVTTAATSRVTIVSAAQVALAEAEAANIGWIDGGTLATSYANGIALSFAQWGVSNPGYATGPKVAISAAGSPDNERRIATQQWLASYPDGHMGWDIFRKTGFPNLTPAPAASNSSGEIVRRFVYASSEYTTNQASVQAAVAREKGPNPGVDSQDNWVWWDIGKGQHK
ncbi:SusD/RagB family nutrient-binding outer membrane lipoprotein [Mucilaginibacter sp.]|uniref:SusD/RagB family nutrient-binding outer membrane lipoprotein n=1 Tax=Mucilaginibacter sp. TaxID=1882438 RepID=UPI003D136A8D